MLKDFTEDAGVLFKNEPVFIQILVRYVAAIFVAFAAATATFFIGAYAVSPIVDDNYGQYVGSYEQLVDSTRFAITGFAGVFSGTFCLERKHRRFGSFVLLAIGFGFSICCFSVSDRGPDDVFLSLLYTLCPLMVGGTAAVLLTRFKLRKNADVPAASGKN